MVHSKFLRVCMATMLAVGLSLLTSPVMAQASDGPFGVSMGDSPTSFGCTEIIGSPGYFNCDYLPKDHPGIDFYTIQAEPGIGACWVKGIGKNIDTNGYGTTIRTEVDTIAAQVAQTYGSGEKSDFLNYESIWHESDEWTTGIKLGERFYAYLFNSTTLPNDVKHIYVGADALDTYTGFVVVEFAFDNYDQCKDAQMKRGASSF